MSSLWRAHPDCPPDARERIEKVVRAFPVGYLKDPRNGEVFESAEACFFRLQGYALAQGFAVVKVSGSLSLKRPRIQYKYVHHSQDIRNFRALEDQVKRDAEGVITSRRKRQNTYILKKHYL
jgi:hypothetical protein